MRRLARYPIAGMQHTEQAIEHAADFRRVFHQNLRLRQVDHFQIARKLKLGFKLAQGTPGMGQIERKAFIGIMPMPLGNVARYRYRSATHLGGEAKHLTAGKALRDGINRTRQPHRLLPHLEFPVLFRFRRTISRQNVGGRNITKVPAGRLIAGRFIADRLIADRFLASRGSSCGL